MDYTDQQLEALRPLSYHMETLDELLARGAVSPEFVEAQRAFYLGEASGIAGVRMDAAQLLTARGLAEGGRLAGFLDFVDLAWILAGGLLLVALLWLIAIYVVPWVAELPRWAHELMMYTACGAMIVAPWCWVDGGGSVALGAVGCLGLVPAVLYTWDYRLRRRDRWRLWRFSRSEIVFRVSTLALGAIWAAAALLHESSFIAALSVGALLAFMGAMALPAWQDVAFVDDEHVPGAMTAALLLLAVGLGAGGLLGPSAAETMAIFRPGAIALGSMAWFGGCLVLASRRYNGRDYDKWLFGQCLAIGSTVIALYVGSVYGVEETREVGGTFAALYLLEQFFELPWKRHGYAWMCLALAGIVYGGASFAERHPEFFLFAF